MILFIVEGEKREPRLIRAMLTTFPCIKGEKEPLIYSYGTDIYKLYKDIESITREGGEADVVALLKEHKKGKKEDPIHSVSRSADVGQIYLIFDYDFQKSVNGNFVPVEEINKEVNEMLNYFNDETDEGRGKLYISYPMVEALYCSQLIEGATDIDRDFLQLKVMRKDCKGRIFKQMANAKLLEQLSPGNPSRCSPNEKLWKLVIKQNLIKANLLCVAEEAPPDCKGNVSQEKIFREQVNKHVLPQNSVGVLSAFPLFLFDYFPENDFYKVILKEKT